LNSLDETIVAMREHDQIETINNRATFAQIEKNKDTVEYM